ncbi:DNA-binding transcriptional LysR family regulator [Mycobacterium frederiksbergense]|uniref:DNA-binding transcriptional LysR family regulator n=1 Tax=Mycolicibacterium frederiksbergense TaxID=117567 RepID=A0ABT6L6G1_9MYCO|nr:LysR family transcriptional regulator [Mycolicibacterium frederiksbergense]MDH6198196.1 DNA-binding transcriptional LysR family regulator [Mycolicibacterium frederiksbergense]
MLNPVHLHTLEVVVETGSFASAARELGYTASAVSQQMEALERAAGLTLFERGARGVQVTAPARMLADRARTVLSDLRELDADVRSIAAGRTGRVKVGCFPTAGARILPAALSDLKRSHPSVEVTLRIAEPAYTIEMVESGELDVAIVYEYAALTRTWPGRLRREALVAEDLVFLSPLDMVVRDTSEIAAKFSDSDWISSGSGTAGESTTYRICADMGFAPNIALRTEYYDLVTEFVAAGIGVAIIPALGIVSRHRVNILPVESKWAQRTVSVVYNEGADNPLIPQVVGSFTQTVRATEWGPYISLAG